VDFFSRLNLNLRQWARVLPANNICRRAAAAGWNYWLNQISESVEIKFRDLSLKLNPRWRSFDANFEGAALTGFLAEIRANDIIWDCGAHIGVYAMLSALTLGGTGKVRAWEPSGLTFAWLTKHIELNGLTRSVECFNSALGDDTLNAVDFYSSESVTDGGEMNRFSRRNLTFDKCRIPVRTLDDWARALAECPSLIKIDVEGAEFAVLRGAPGLLSGAFGKPPSILLSVHPLFLRELGQDETMLTALVRSFNYEIEDLMGQPGDLSGVKEFWLRPRL
jgi:FkbM family methyltransferase